MYKKEYDLIFVTTFNSVDWIEHLLYSVATQNNIVDLLIVVVAQDGLKISTSEFQSGKNNIIVLSEIEAIGLSTARNIALRYICEKNIVYSHIMFPDDDSTFSSDFFLNFRNTVLKNTCYLIDVLNQGTITQYKQNHLIDGVNLYVDDYKYAMSVNMIIDFGTLNKVQYFDPEMGVGAKYGAGEDQDFYIRCCRNDASFVYSKLLFNYHELSLTKREYKLYFYIQYSKGSKIKICCILKESEKKII